MVRRSFFCWRNSWTSPICHQVWNVSVYDMSCLTESQFWIPDENSLLTNSPLNLWEVSVQYFRYREKQVSTFVFIFTSCSKCLSDGGFIHFFWVVERVTLYINFLEEDSSPIKGMILIQIGDIFHPKVSRRAYQDCGLINQEMFAEVEFR